MIKRLRNYFLFLFLTSNHCFATNIDDLNWVIQEFPPYVSIDSSTHKVNGIVIDLVNVLLQKLNSKKSDKDFNLEPFSRAIIDANDPKTAFFPLARTPERENMFKWVGPISVYKPVIWAKKSKKVNPADIKNNVKKYTIGTRENNIINIIIAKEGFHTSNIQPVSLDIFNIKKLNADRIDLVACDYSEAVLLFKELGYNINDFEIVYNFPKIDFAIAFSKDVSDDLIQEIQTTLDKIKVSSNNNSSLYDKIQNNYQ